MERFLEEKETPDVQCQRRRGENNSTYGGMNLLGKFRKADRRVKIFDRRARDEDDSLNVAWDEIHGRTLDLREPFRHRDGPRSGRATA